MIIKNLPYTNMNHTVKSFQEILENLRELDSHDAIQCHEYDEASKNQLIEDCKEFLEYFDNQNYEEQQSEISEDQQEQPEITEETSEDVEAPQTTEIDEAEEQATRKHILTSLPYIRVDGIGEKTAQNIWIAVQKNEVTRFNQLQLVKGISEKRYYSKTMQELLNVYEVKCQQAGIKY